MSGSTTSQGTGYDDHGRRVAHVGPASSRK
jgi:hypothetical protein